MKKKLELKCKIAPLNENRRNEFFSKIAFDREVRVVFFLSIYAFKSIKSFLFDFCFYIQATFYYQIDAGICKIPTRKDCPARRSIFSLSKMLCYDSNAIFMENPHVD